MHERTLQSLQRATNAEEMQTGTREGIRIRVETFENISYVFCCAVG